MTFITDHRALSHPRCHQHPVVLYQHLAQKGFLSVTELLQHLPFCPSGIHWALFTRRMSESIFDSKAAQSHFLVLQTWSFLWFWEPGHRLFPALIWGRVCSSLAHPGQVPPCLCLLTAQSFLSRHKVSREASCHEIERQPVCAHSSAP